MSAEDEIAKLDACKNKVSALDIAIQANIDIKEYNDAQDEKARIAIQVWEERKRHRHEEQEDWQEEWRKKFDESETDIKVTLKYGRVSFPWWCQTDFGNDWEDYGSRITVAGEERRNCRMTLAAREKRTTEKILDSKGVIKPDLIEPKPEPRTGEFSLKDYVALDANIECCSELKDMKPEEASKDYLNRTSKCVVDMERARQPLLVKKEEQYKEKLKLEAESKLEQEKYKIAAQANAIPLTIAAIILASCVSLSMSFGGLAFMKKSGGN